MRFIKQLGIILAFTFAGDLVVRLVPGRLPAIVMGMVLMLIALGAKLLKPEHIKECADFLGGIMAFFFVPLSVTILQNYKTLLPVLAQIVFIVVFCTFFTFFISYWTFRGTSRLLSILQNRKK
jgi:holin-like protein